jgi:hypothetical protein
LREKEAEDMICQGALSRGKDLSGREAEDKIKIDKQINSKLILDVCCTLCSRLLIRVFFLCTDVLLHLPRLRLHCIGGYWDRTQDCCEFGIGSQTL